MSLSDIQSSLYIRILKLSIIAYFLDYKFYSYFIQDLNFIIKVSNSNKKCVCLVRAPMISQDEYERNIPIMINLMKY